MRLLKVGIIRFTTLLFVTIICGWYYYFLQQLIFLLRFKRFKLPFESLDVSLFAIGIVSIWLLLFFLKRSQQNKRKLIIYFFIAMPCSLFLSIFGGLFGPIGVLVTGIAPFAIALGYADVNFPSLKGGACKSSR